MQKKCDQTSCLSQMTPKNPFDIKKDNWSLKNDFIYVIYLFWIIAIG